MWRSCRSLRLVLVAGVLCVSAATAGATDRSRVSPFDLHDGGDIVVRVTLNGNGPFRFLLDTGSSRSAVSASVANALMLVPLADTTLITPTGQSERPIAVLRRLELGAAPPTNVLAMIVPDAELQSSRGVDGIVGQDVLGSLTYTIDYVNRHIVWHVTPPTDVDGHRLPLWRSDYGLLVTLPQRSGIEDLHFVPDTGANGWVLFADERRLPSTTSLGTASVHSLSGARSAASAIIEELWVGAITFRNQRAVIITRDWPVRLPGDGLLPLHLFARVTFNPRAHQLIVEGR